MIRRATIDDASMLSKISKASFIPAHGHSAPKGIINEYMELNFSEANFKYELSNPNNHYYLIYYEKELAGYSKIVFNQYEENTNISNATYMSRLYLLKEFYGLGLGKKLFDFNIQLCKENNQKSIWLKVWVENEKGIAFYNKMGFEKVGLSDFKLSESHYNPNYILSLTL